MIPGIYSDWSLHLFPLTPSCTLFLIACLFGHIKNSSFKIPSNNFLKLYLPICVSFLAKNKYINLKKGGEINEFLSNVFSLRKRTINVNRKSQLFLPLPCLLCEGVMFGAATVVYLWGKADGIGAGLGPANLNYSVSHLGWATSGFLMWVMLIAFLL